MMPNQNLQPNMLHPSARSRDRNNPITGNNQGFANNLIWLKKTCAISAIPLRVYEVKLSCQRGVVYRGVSMQRNTTSFF